MPAFQSADAYGRCARAVTRSTRYVRDSQANDFLDALVRQASDRVDVVPARRVLWRAQLDHGWEPVREGSEVIDEVRLTQSDLQKVISEFDKNYGDGNRDSRPSPHGT